MTAKQVLNAGSVSWKKQKDFANHVVAAKQAATEVEFAMHCVADESCVSVIIKFLESVKVKIKHFERCLMPMKN